MEESIEYFVDNDYRFFNDIGRNEEFFQTKKILIDYSLGDVFNSLLPDSQDNLISAEIEYQKNKDTPTYDFGSVVIKLSKVAEQEIYRFLKVLFTYLIELEPELEKVKYELQGSKHNLRYFLRQKPSLGTYKYLLNKNKTPEITNTIFSYVKHPAVKFFATNVISGTINKISPVRGKAAHAEPVTLQECKTIRDYILGSGHSSLLVELFHANRRLVAGIK
ncbi:MAG: hypothetical protein OIF32_00325, partial [Campylobacterales bacterium]|nr:hypothetical protein [Campylobacterales bacterium]